MSADPSWGRVPVLERLGTCPPAPRLPWHAASPRGGGTWRGWGVPPYLPLALQRPLHLRHLPPFQQQARGRQQRGTIPRRHRPAAGCVELIVAGVGRGGEPGRGHPSLWHGRGPPGTTAACWGSARGGLARSPFTHPSSSASLRSETPQRHCSTPGKEKSRHNLSTHPVTPPVGTHRREHKTDRPPGTEDALAPLPSLCSPPASSTRRGSQAGSCRSRGEDGGGNLTYSSRSLSRKTVRKYSSRSKAILPVPPACREAGTSGGRDGGSTTLLPGAAGGSRSSLGFSRHGSEHRPRWRGAGHGDCAEAPRGPARRSVPLAAL